MRVAATVLVGSLVLAGCSGSSDAAKAPAASSFAEGTCRTVAPDVLELGRDASRLGDGGEVPAEVLSSLEKAQTNIRPLVEAAEPTYKPALDKLVIAVGLVRLQARVGTYRVETGDNLTKAYELAVQACTTSSSSSATPTS